jgi:hypothetical protein
MAMTRWKMTMIEPTLDDLLEDDMMGAVMRSAGISADELRAKLSETARRLSGKGWSTPKPRFVPSC